MNPFLGYLLVIVIVCFAVRQWALRRRVRRFERLLKALSARRSTL